MKEFSLLLSFMCFASSAIAKSSAMTLEERYRLLCDAKAQADASAVAERDAAIEAVEEGKYVDVYKSLLAAHRREERTLRLLTFRGRIIDKRNVVLGKKEMVILAMMWNGGTFEITATLDDSPREELRLGSVVLISGTFVRGTFTGVHLKHANVTLVQKLSTP